jgi:hypothetical protein
MLREGMAEMDVLIPYKLAESLIRKGKKEPVESLAFWQRR